MKHLILICMLFAALCCRAAAPNYVRNPWDTNAVPVGGVSSNTTLTGITTNTGPSYFTDPTANSMLWLDSSNRLRAATIGAGLLFSSGTLSATGGGGSVTSVGLSVPGGLSVGGSPVTTSGTLTITAANTAGFWVNDGSGSTSFRLVQTSDIPDPLKLGTFQATTVADLNSIVLTNEQRIVQTAWANGPTGSYDCSVPLQTYTISAASALSSFANTRTSLFANYSEFDVTNAGASDLTLYLTAIGVTTPDGARSYVCTNKSATTFRIESSSMGIWVYPIRHL